MASKLKYFSIKKRIFSPKIYNNVANKNKNDNNINGAIGTKHNHFNSQEISIDIQKMLTSYLIIDQYCIAKNMKNNE